MTVLGWGLRKTRSKGGVLPALDRDGRARPYRSKVERRLPFPRAEKRIENAPRNRLRLHLHRLSAAKYGPGSEEDNLRVSDWLSLLVNDAAGKVREVAARSARGGSGVG